MSELVLGGGYIFGMPISMIAALVIVLMEVAAGIFVVETFGITHLFPRLSGLPASRRRIIFLVALTGLATWQSSRRRSPSCASSSWKPTKPLP